jgi:hypothetical protein
MFELKRLFENRTVPQPMSRQRKIYQSENGDSWWLCHEEDGGVCVLHEANVSSGGNATKLEIADFLHGGQAGPEHQTLIRLIGIWSRSIDCNAGPGRPVASRATPDSPPRVRLAEKMRRRFESERGRN